MVRAGNEKFRLKKPGIVDALARNTPLNALMRMLASSRSIAIPYQFLIQDIRDLAIFAQIDARTNTAATWGNLRWSIVVVSKLGANSSFDKGAKRLARECGSTLGSPEEGLVGMERVVLMHQSIQNTAS